MQKKLFGEMEKEIFSEDDLKEVKTIDEALSVLESAQIFLERKCIYRNLSHIEPMPTILDMLMLDNKK